MPNREAVVKFVCSQYPQAFQGTDRDKSRRLLIPIICGECNKLDGDEVWKLLFRMDREDDDPEPGRLSSDILVYSPTKEHFDVLTDNGPTWKSVGIVSNPKWLLRSWREFPSYNAPTNPISPVSVPPIPIPPKVSYDEFVNKESWEIFQAYFNKHGHGPAVSDLYHSAWRRLVERWKHEDILKNI